MDREEEFVYIDDCIQQPFLNELKSLMFVYYEDLLWVIPPDKLPRWYLKGAFFNGVYKEDGKEFCEQLLERREFLKRQTKLFEWGMQDAADEDSRMLRRSFFINFILYLPLR